MEKFDCLIIGGGPAGIMAAIYLVRANIRNIAVFNNRSGSLTSVHAIENLYGFESITGEELYERGERQAKRFGIPLLEEIVVHINYDWNTNDIEVVTNKGSYLTRSLIFATGKKRTTLKVPGLKELEGHGVSYCATCDGFFYRKKSVAVVGSKEFAFNEYDYLKNLASEIVLLTNGDDIKNDRNIDKRVIKEFSSNENGKVIVSFNDGNFSEFDGVFIALGNASSVDFARQLGIEVSPNNDIIIDQNCKTNFDNIYAAGDCTGGILQISKAEYEGMLAGMKVSNYLRGKN